MKKHTKVLVLLLAALLLFCGCENDTPAGSGTEGSGAVNSSAAPADLTEVRVAVLNGTTGFGIAPLDQKLKTQGSGKLNAKIDYYADATLISPLLISGSVDVAAVPTNLAAVLYNKTEGKVQVLGINTLGVLYVLDTGVGLNALGGLSDFAGKTVCVPGSGTNPEYVLRAILKKKGLEDKVTVDTSNASPDALAAAVLSDKAPALALLPEPKVSVTRYKYLLSYRMVDHAYHSEVCLDVSEEWKEAFGCDLVQGCFVVRKEFAEQHPQAVKAFAEEYTAAFTASTEDEKIDAVIAAGLLPGTLFETPVAYTELSAEEYKKENYRNLLSRCNLVSQFGEEIRTPLLTYWQALYDIIPSAVGGKMPDTNIFYGLQ